MTRLVAAWLTPALLLGVPSALIAEGRDGLWVALLFVIAPLVAASTAVSRRAAWPEAGRRTFPLVAMLLVVGLLLWANLSLAGDVASWMGQPRWRGILPAVVALAGLLWPRAARAWRWLVPAGLLALVLPVAVVVHASHTDPIATWSQVASQPAFRFGAGSPWVTEGRALGLRSRPQALSFEEEHRVTPLDPGPVRVEVRDQGRLQVQEWTLAPGQSVTLRPGDRLQVDHEMRLKFEANKRVPGAPLSGIAWADTSPFPRGVMLIRLLGLALTLAGGAVGLVGFAAPTAPTRASVGLAGLVLLVSLGWAECWAIYAARWAPELFVGGVSAAALVELPALLLRPSPWGSRLAGVGLAGLAALFLAASVALREQLAMAEGEEGGPLESDAGLWGGVFAVTALAALWPVEPWSLVLTALGLGASTVAPLIFLGMPTGRPAAAACAVGVGLALFLGLTALGRLGVQGGSVGQTLLTYPALVATPVAGSILWVARRPARP